MQPSKLLDFFSTSTAIKNAVVIQSSLERNVVWPPRISLTTPLGYLRDTSGNYYPRDIGRSTKLSSGSIIWQFGDTFCYGMERNYTGITDNTCSVGKVENPTLSSYPVGAGTEDSMNDTFSENTLPPLLAPYPENLWPNLNLKLWAFSGIVEYDCNEDIIRGWTFYELSTYVPGSNDTTIQAVIVAEIIHHSSTGKTSATLAGQGDYQLFKAKEPRFGSFSILKGPDNYLYAYGHLTPTKNVGLSRVKLDRAPIREDYQYWDGQNWTKIIEHAKPVITNMQHGQIFETKMFGSQSKFKYAFFGCNASGDSKAIFGRAIAPEGPWDMHVLNLDTYSMNQNPAAFRYCFYPHPWALDGYKGDLLVSWSEGGMDGSVITVQIRFETTVQEPPAAVE